MTIKFNNAIYHYDNEDVSYHYHIELIPNVIYVLHGESGVGKTTFFDVLAGFLKLKSGDFTLDNEVISDKTVAERPINYLFQSNNLFEHLTAFQNVALAADQGLKLNEEQREAVNTMLKNCGVQELSNKRPNALSGGQSQRVALSRAFLRNRAILLLDEPFNGLDRANIDAIMKLIEYHLKKPNHYCLVISHELQHFDKTPHRVLGFEEKDSGVWLKE